jgi:hypothetical protein
MTTLTHKHCVFCGKSSDYTGDMGICRSPLNCTPVDTVGNKHHVYPTDIKERAKIAAERARQTDLNEIEFFMA